jgi:hypothetical protein
VHVQLQLEKLSSEKTSLLREKGELQRQASTGLLCWRAQQCTQATVGCMWKLQERIGQQLCACLCHSTTGFAPLG